MKIKVTLKTLIGIDGELLNIVMANFKFMSTLYFKSNYLRKLNLNLSYENPLSY